MNQSSGRNCRFFPLGMVLVLLAGCGDSTGGGEAGQSGSGGTINTDGSAGSGASGSGGAGATSGSGGTTGSGGGGTGGAGGSAGGAGTDAGTGKGGSAGTGAAGAGGRSGSGGASGSGGSAGTAGAAGSDAGTGKGGNAGAGGSSGSGGAAGAAGASGKGGAAGTGGAAGASGSSADGGVPDAGALKKFVGNITTNNSIDTGGMKYSKYWDQITPENAGKWGSVQSTPSSAFNWATLDAIYNYAQTNNIVFKQHTFVWGSQQPSGTPTLEQVENWIKSFCQRYPNTKLIDVVNEPPPHTTPNYTAALGSGETGTYGWITKAFKLARQHCGSATLILNDYNNIEYADQETHFIDIVNQIKSAGAPIDAVGVQAHAAHSFSASTIQANIDSMASKTGLPIYVTEYDVPEASDATQLSVYQAQFPVFWNTSSVHGITIWGWINGSTWLANSGLVNGTTPRTAMTWLMQQLGRPVPPN
jgi:endo-1,4-beta-xylanase